MPPQAVPRFEVEVVDALSHEPDERFNALDDAALEHDLRGAASEVAAATSRWLTLLAEAVRRGLWAQQGARTPAHWLSWLVSMAPSTAREQIRVALRLRDFPETATRFAEGTLSYSQVRAITRLAEPRLERLLLQFAQYATGSHLDRIVRDFDGSRRAVERTPDDAPTHDLSWVEDDDALVVTLRVPLHDGLAAVAKLDDIAARTRRDAGRAAKRWEEDGHDPEDGPDVPSLGRARADAALVALESIGSAGMTDGEHVHTLVLHADADDLAEEPPGTGASAEAPDPVTVQVDGAAGRLGNRRPAMSRNVLRRLACRAGYRLVGHDNGVEGISGTTRAIPPRIRAALWARDGGCRFPGCTARWGIEAHHIQHWADGGPTTLPNLVLLCRHHHGWIHDRGWTILHDGRGHVRVARPDHTVVPTRLPLLAASAEAPGDASVHRDPSALKSGWDGVPPDRNACVEALWQELERLQPPAGVTEAA